MLVYKNSFIHHMHTSNDRCELIFAGPLYDRMRAKNYYFELREYFDTDTNVFTYKITRYTCRRRWFFFGDCTANELDVDAFFSSFDLLCKHLPWNSKLSPMYEFLTTNDLLPSFFFPRN